MIGKNNYFCSRYANKTFKLPHWQSYINIRISMCSRKAFIRLMSAEGCATCVSDRPTYSPFAGFVKIISFVFSFSLLYLLALQNFVDLVYYFCEAY